jgi:anti-anti-sigma factor
MRIMESDESGKYDVHGPWEPFALGRAVGGPSYRFDAQPGPGPWEPEAGLLDVVGVAPRMFRVVGELDLSSVHVAETALEPELPVRGDLTLDLSDLFFMDSTGLHLLIRIALSLSGDLILQSPRPHVVRVLELSRVTTIPNVVVRTSSRPSGAERLAETGPENTT